MLRLMLLLLLQQMTDGDHAAAAAAAPLAGLWTRYRPQLQQQLLVLVRMLSARAVLLQLQLLMVAVVESLLPTAVGWM
jgi:hypothetical protein